MFSFTMALLLASVSVSEVDNVYSRSVPCCGLTTGEGGTGGAGGSKTPRSEGVPHKLAVEKLETVNRLIVQRLKDKEQGKRLASARDRVAATIKDGKPNGPAYDRALQQLVTLERQLSKGDRQELRNILSLLHRGPTSVVCCTHWNSWTGGTGCATYPDACPDNTFTVKCGKSGCW